MNLCPAICEYQGSPIHGTHKNALRPKIHFLYHVESESAIDPKSSNFEVIVYQPIIVVPVSRPDVDGRRWIGLDHSDYCDGHVINRLSVLFKVRLAEVGKFNETTLIRRDGDCPRGIIFFRGSCVGEDIFRVTHECRMSG